MTQRRVLITGGSRGIGLAVARTLAAEGWRTVLVARSQERLDAALAGLSGEGHEAIALDVADEVGWEGAISAADAGGVLDGLVAAAGVLGPIGSLGSWEPRDFRAAIDVNLHGTMLALHHALPRLAERGGAAVTFSGGGGTAPLPRFDAYAASKAAVIRLTENVAAAGARVNCVAPGFIATEIHEATLAAGPAAVGEEYFERTRAELEAGGASVEVVCELVSFLLSPESREISGKLVAAQWDPWREPEFRARLAEEPDLATLRRIDDFGFGKLERG